MMREFSLKSLWKQSSKNGNIDLNGSILFSAGLALVCRVEFQTIFTLWKST